MMMYQIREAPVKLIEIKFSTVPESSIFILLHEIVVNYVTLFSLEQ